MNGTGRQGSFDGIGMTGPARAWACGGAWHGLGYWAAGWSIRWPVVATMLGLVIWTAMEVFFTPVGQADYERTVQHGLLAGLLVLFAGTVVVMPLDAAFCRSRVVWAAGVYGALVACHAMVRWSEAWSYGVAVTAGKHVFWIAGLMAAFRWQRAGWLRAGDLVWAARLVAACVAVRLIVSVFDGTWAAYEATGWAYWIAWLLPLLLLDVLDGSKGRGSATVAGRRAGWSGLTAGAVVNGVVITVGVAAVMCTLKRGAMLAVVAGLVCAAVGCRRVHGGGWRGLVGAAIGLAALMGAVLAWRWDALIERMADFGSLETAGSWRGTFYGLIGRQWYGLDVVRQVFGAGFWAVPDLMERVWARQYAHSDWLEVLYDYGLVGVGLFVWLNAALGWLVVRAWRLRDAALPALAMGVSVFWLRGLYSGCTFWPETVWFGLLVGYAGGQIEGGVACGGMNGVNRITWDKRTGGGCG